RVDIESTVCGNGLYDVSNAARVIPYTGTENCGLPRDAMGVSQFASLASQWIGSQVLRSGVRLKSENHSHAVNNGTVQTTATVASERSLWEKLAFNAHLRGSGVAQDLFCILVLIGCRVDKDPKIAAREPGIVPHGGGDVGDPRVGEHP